MKEFEELVKIVEKLRSKDGCPWDKEQTMKTLMDKVIEEVNELKEAIDKKDNENIKEEIGDIFWSLILIIDIAKEKKLFDVKDVLEEVRKKIIRRHPHVFGDKKAKNAKEALKCFLEAKKKEKSKK